MDVRLPLLLSGPILRRCEAQRVCVWLATSEPCDIEVSVYALDGGRRGERLGSAGARRVSIGSHLHLHLAQVVPDRDTFPRGRLLGYEVAARGHDDLAPPGGWGSLCYPGCALPSFFLPDGPHTRILHGSCHRLHGTGDDAFPLGDSVIEPAPLDLASRPSMLLLTGDQIYADSVAGPLIAHLTRLGDTLLGWSESASLPGIPPLAELGVYARTELCHRRGRLSSGDCANHLLSFGEYAAMYLVSWNEELWPEPLPPALRPEPGAGKARTAYDLVRYALESKEVRRARPGIPQIRRLLANVPTYMMFDDHDITDDLYITQEWHTNVWESLTGRRVIANGLAAAWAFQMWGNDPEAFPDRLCATVASVGAPGGPEAGYDEALWGFDRWSFACPGDPPTIVLDTRTRRHYDGWREPACLLNRDELRRMVALAGTAGHRRGDPLVVVSPVPVYELPLWEGPQKYIAYALGPYDIDLEAWRSNMSGFTALMDTIVDELAPCEVVFLSGDLHYGYSMTATYDNGRGRVPAVQLTSSGVKNSMAFNRYVTRPLAFTLHETDSRVGWRQQPRFERSPARRTWLRWREEKIEGGSFDGPTWLSPQRAAALRPDREPDYVETRSYASVAHIVRSPIVGKNNIGLVTLRDGGVMHELMARSRHSVESFSALLPRHAVAVPGAADRSALV